MKSGRISEARVDQSVRRILKSKGACGVFDRRLVDADVVGTIVGRDSHKQLAQTIASQAITIVQNRSDLVPLKLQKDVPLLIISPSRALFNLFRHSHSNSTDVRISEKFDTEQILPQLINQAEVADVVLAGIVNHRQANLIHQLSGATQTPIIVIALGSPYSLQRCPNVNVSLAAYDGHDASVLAAVEVILGKSKAQGKLPITLP